MFNDIQIKKNFETLKKLEITKDEFYVAFLIFHISKKSASYQDALETYHQLLLDFKNTVACFDESLADMKIPLLPQSIERLVKCGLFTKLEAATGKYKINDEKFSEIFADIKFCIEELMELFRNSGLKLEIQGKQLSIVNVDNIEEFKKIYISAISGSKIEHDEVILDCKYAIKNNLVDRGLAKIVANKQWLEWRKERKHNINVNVKQIDGIR